MTRASRFLIGLVTCFATHDHIPAIARSMRPVIRQPYDDSPVDVLLWIYAKCVAGQDELAKRRISEALRQN